MRLSLPGLVAVIGCCCLFATTGCGSKPASQPDSKPSERQGGSVDTLLKNSSTPTEASPAPAAPSPGAQSDNAAPVAAASASGADTSTMTQVDPQVYVKLTYSLFKFKEKYQRMPRDWDEVISTKFLDKLPPAPAGKHYAFDPSCTVYLK